ncbi:MAG: zinc-ribbon domain-containing protein, partial [Dehalococcoidia bacterium]|nr:zinc-ribbon domain-containing protein [Dehalococcoidia bacterium]
MYCQKCGAQNDDQAAFCDKCGAALQKAGPALGAGVLAAPGTVQYAGFWRRFGAAVIDGLIMGAVQWVLQM